MKNILLSAKLGEEYEWYKWIKEIPAINFPKKWGIHIIPPFGGAIARFRVTYKDARVSVYLDCYDELGYFGEPYWEVYPYEDDVYRIKMKDTKELVKIINESIIQQEIKEC